MEENKPLVSIIIRTKDRPKLLKNALKSVAAQTCRPIEVVLVNDGGCDLDVDELKNILGDISLNYVRLEKNTGRAHAGNVGIDNTSGEYIGFLDDDDEFYPEHISILTNCLLKSNFKVAYTDAHLVRQKYNSELEKTEEIIEGTFTSEDFSYDVLLFENYIPLNTLLFHEGIFKETGNFNEMYEIFEDWDLLIRTAELNPFNHIPTVTAKYIQWSKELQIANVDWPGASSNYLAILTKYAHRRTSDTAYKYFLRKLEQLKKKDLIIKALDGEKSAIQQKTQSLGADSKKDKIELLETRSQLNAAQNTLYSTQNTLYRTQNELQAIKKEMQTLKSEIQHKNAYIAEVKSSLGWRILENYRWNIRSRLVPIGTKQWKIYNKILKGVKDFKEHGVKTSAGKLKRLLREEKASSHIKKEDFTIPSIREKSITPSDIKVSVVIPTLNAGEDFAFLLERIRKQKGLKDIEIVIVDSGSEDDTVKIANRYGAKIISIQQYEFNHGKTRDLGARHANGDYLFILTQDAIPIGHTCFAEIVEGMKNDEKIAAVSVRQIPRSDADLFSCWQLWNHYEKFLGYSEDSVVSIEKENFKSLHPSDRRRMAQIDDVLSCIRKDIFDQYGFNRVSYAEDLDLGLRLIKNGYKIGFLSSVGVIHSHNRESFYYFKRSIIDRKTLIDFLGYEPVDWYSIGINSPDQMVKYIQSGYYKINSALHSLGPGVTGKTVFAGLFESLRSFILTHQGNGRRPGFDREMDLIIERLASQSSPGNNEVSVTSDVLTEQYLAAFESFREFMSVYEETSDKNEEIISSLYKLNSVVLGANIGDYMAYHKINGNSEQTLNFDKVLGDLT